MDSKDGSIDLSKLKGISEQEQRIRGMVLMAKAMEKMERFEDMCTVVRELVKSRTDRRKELTAEERKLVATAFKNIAGQLRGAWRALWTEDQFPEAVDHYKLHVQHSLSSFCTTALDLVAAHSKAVTLSTDNQVFVLKLQGDFHRYLAEIAKDNNKSQSSATKASDCYQEATSLAEEKLDPTHPLRLGVALNFAVCYREIFSDTKQACQMAKKAFNQSIARLDDVEDEEYNDTTLIMQLLRDNLTLWASESG